MDRYFDLGSYSRSISTISAEAQTWFDRGLNWCYAFHQEEAVRCFYKVLEHDPDCAMGYWGIAYATGPNYNLPWDYFAPHRLTFVVAETYASTQEALHRIDHASPVEQGLIRALARRYQAPPYVDRAEFGRWVDDYAIAMRDLQTQFPDDPDVRCLTADALMSRTPWELWDLQKGEPAEGASTLEAIALLEEGLDAREDRDELRHPGLLHYYIHAMEMSPWPEKALLASHRLRYLALEAGHLLHMPSHIYALCGNYELALDANTDAIEADRKYAAYRDEIGTFAISRCHNYQFKIHAAMMLGQYQPAIETANELIDIIPYAGIHHEQAFLAHTLEGYSAMKAHVQIRFGKWEEIIAEPLPENPDVYKFTTALWYYAKAIAYAALGDGMRAELQKNRFELFAAKIPASRKIFNNSCQDILAVARYMMRGEVAYHGGNYERAFDDLRKAVELYDDLSYTEPWAWMHPVRHALGALLLAQGHVEEAAAVYRADLGLDDTVVRPSQHPDNIWSLHGYVECLRQLGRDGEADALQPQLDRRLISADSNITSSCFCRKPGCCSDTP